MCSQRGRGKNDYSFESLLGRRSSHREDETDRANDLFPDRIPWSTVCSSESIFSTNGGTPAVRNGEDSRNSSARLICIALMSLIPHRRRGTRHQWARVDLDHAMRNAHA